MKGGAREEASQGGQLGQEVQICLASEPARPALRGAGAGGRAPLHHAGRQGPWPRLCSGGGGIPGAGAQGQEGQGVLDLTSSEGRADASP